MTRVSRSARGRFVAVAGAAVLLLAACGGDDDSGGDEPPAAGDNDADADSGGGDDAADAGGDAGNSGGGGGGELVFDGETITFDRPLCFLQEQDGGPGGGKILLTAQAQGMTAAGQQIELYFSRYDEDSQFHGDDVSIDLGDFTDGSYVELFGGGEVGLVSLDGSTLSASDLTFDNFEAGTQHTASFKLNC